MNATGKRRLLKLADFLETLPESKKFDMAVLADDVVDGRPACGSAGCALGWGSLIPSFRRAGYCLTKRGHLSVPGVRSAWYDGHAAHFFDIDTSAVEHVFGAAQAHMTGARARRDVVRRIRALVASSKARGA